MKLGRFQIPHPFIMAPMAGITTSPFRRLMRRLDSPIVISELISANGLEYSSERTFEMLKFFEDERIVGLQIFSERPELLVKACQMIERMNADFIDLNLGCPVPKVIKKGAGAAMCRNPRELFKTLKAMVESVKIPVSIKIRTGWDHESINLHEVIQAATDAGVEWVAIHGRTRAQGYSGEADWELIGEAKQKATIPIVGNGDIVTPEIAVSRYKTYGVDAVLIGRGVLKNPFLLRQAKEILEGKPPYAPSAHDYLELIDQQKVLLEESHDAKMAMIHGRKFLSWYASGYPGCHDFRKRVFASSDPELLWKDARVFFEKNLMIRDQGDLSQPFLMGGHG